MNVSVWTDATFVLQRKEGLVLYVAYVESISTPNTMLAMLKAYAYIVMGGVFDNNDAEHQALLWANRIVDDRFKIKESATYYSDSQFAVNKLGLSGAFNTEYKHVPRIENKVSPYLVAVSNELRNHFRHDKDGMSTKIVGRTIWKDLP